MDNINTWTGIPVEESVRMTEGRINGGKYVHGVSNPLDRGRLKNTTVRFRKFWLKLVAMAMSLKHEKGVRSVTYNQIPTTRWKFEHRSSRSWNHFA